MKSTMKLNFIQRQASEAEIFRTRDNEHHEVLIMQRPKIKIKSSSRITSQYHNSNKMVKTPTIHTEQTSGNVTDIYANKTTRGTTRIETPRLHAELTFGDEQGYTPIRPAIIKTIP